MLLDRIKPEHNDFGFPVKVPGRWKQMELIYFGRRRRFVLYTAKVPHVCERVCICSYIAANLAKSPSHGVRREWVCGENKMRLFSLFSENNLASEKALIEIFAHQQQPISRRTAQKRGWNRLIMVRWEMRREKYVCFLEKKRSGAFGAFVIFCILGSVCHPSRLC